MRTMPETPLIVSIDTEGDDIWSKPREITTRNADYLPRFQALCERFGFKPVYLANYEMAMSDAFVEFGREVLARGAGEIGMHLHAWNSPPIAPLTADDFRFQPYLIEYPEEVMREKIRTMTRLLEDRFDEAIVSHRAGRLGFDERYASILLDEGYRVDCSVSPCLDWRSTPGDPAGNGGTDYRDFPSRPYFFDPADIAGDLFCAEFVISRGHGSIEVYRPLGGIHTDSRQIRRSIHCESFLDGRRDHRIIGDGRRHARRRGERGQRCHLEIVHHLTDALSVASEEFGPHFMVRTWHASVQADDPLLSVYADLGGVDRAIVHEASLHRGSDHGIVGQRPDLQPIDHDPVRDRRRR